MQIPAENIIPNLQDWVYFFLCVCGGKSMQKFPAQGSNPHHSSVNARSLNPQLPRNS